MCMPPVAASGLPSPSRSPVATVCRCVGDGGDAAQREAHRAVVLQPQQARRRRVVPVVVRGHEQDVEIAVAVEIGRLGAGRALQVHHAVELEAAGCPCSRATARPATAGCSAARTRRRRRWHTGCRDRRRDPDRPSTASWSRSRGWSSPRSSAARSRRLPSLTKRPDLLPLLADQRDDVGPLVAVDVRRARR